MNELKTYHITSKLLEMDVTGTRVFLRADLNVPLRDGVITDDFRLQSILPTLEWLIKHGAHVVLATHIGRPKGVDLNLSTQHLIPWFTARGYNAYFAHDPEQARMLVKERGARFVLIENLRFWPEEKTHDLVFARQLRACADLYVMDAFGAAHRADTSVALLPTLFEPQERTIGFLVEKELRTLNQLMESPAHPFVLMLGGAKLSTKLPLIEHLLPMIDVVLTLPLISQALAGEDFLGIAVLDRVQQLGKKILFPSDYLVSLRDWDGPYSVASSEQVKKEHKIISVGPQTVKIYSAELAHAKTIFMNGFSGDLKYSASYEPVRELVSPLCHQHAMSVVAGGDSTGIIRVLGLQACVNSLSTGGGASLAYLSGQELPGLKLLS